MTELPTTFGKYYLTEKLATGGMAEIYLAKIIGPGGFEKQVVIKQIHPKLSGQRQFVDMFVAEAKTLVTLTHGNIVPVYELGVVDDTYYIAMDYIDGPTLYRLTETMAGREVRMEPAVAAWITGRIIEGLDYAHRKGEGVIHRDLSPRNVMLSRDGEVKLVDFGIAVTLGGPGEVVGRDEAPTGSFPYMSPEQVRRETLTIQTDLFSAGVLMWEMLTGERLFQRPDADATLAAVLREPIRRPSQVRADVPARLDEVVMRALERDAATRWTNASDMLGAINKYLYSLDQTPGPRDVAALVARFCPPETRRLPTHLEAMAATDEDDEDDAAVDSASNDRAAASGPSTAVIPRSGAAVAATASTAVIPRSGAPAAAMPSTAVVPRSPVVPPVADAPPKPTSRPQRHKSFATNIDIAPILDGTGPVPAIRDDSSPAAAENAVIKHFDKNFDKNADNGIDRNVARASEPPGETPPRRGPPGNTPPGNTPSGNTPSGNTPSGNTPSGNTPSGRPPLPGSTPPSRGVLVVAGLGALALAGAAIYVFYRGREQVLNAGEDAAVYVETSRDARAPVDATELPDTSIATALSDGGVGRDAARDAREAPRDAREAPRDGSARDGSARDGSARDATARHVDATTVALPRPDAAIVDASARGTATLTIGADPWGEIYVDGKLSGRTPRELVVPAGHHTIEVVFPAETPPRKQTFAVDLAAGETKPIQADFTR